MSNMQSNGSYPRNGTYFSEWSKEEQQAFIEEARRELPALKARLRKSRENVRRLREDLRQGRYR